MRTTWWTLIVAAGLAAAVIGQTTAQSPSPYAVTPAAGHWLICVPINYSGNTGGQLANDLVTELRSHYRLPAYLYNKGTAERQKEQARIDQLRHQQQDFLKQMGVTEMPKFRIKTVHIEDEYVVLIGGPKNGWRTMDEATKALKDIRGLKQPSAKLLDTAFVRDGAQVHAQPINPFRSAFVVHNPTVPRAPDNEAHAYPWLRALNQGMPYSLLKNPKPWTLVIKQYQGPAAIQTNRDSSDSFLKKLGLGSNSTDVLSATAVQAGEFAKFLRDPKLNFKAYVLHTPYKSIVCVGGFNSKDDPNMAQVYRSLSVTLASLKIKGPAVDLSIFPQPIPLEVPRP